MAFHISPKDGQARPCKAASTESCPLGGTHYENEREAQVAAEEKLNAQYDTSTGLSKKTPETSATITIDLSSASSDTLKAKFLENLREMYPVSSVKTDGMGSYTVVVDADSDPSNYSVLMAASVAVNNAATDMGYDDEELENLNESLSIDVDLTAASADTDKTDENNFENSEWRRRLHSKRKAIAAFHGVDSNSITTDSDRNTIVQTKEGSVIYNSEFIRQI